MYWIIWIEQKLKNNKWIGIEHDEGKKTPYWQFSNVDIVCCNRCLYGTPAHRNSSIDEFSSECHPIKLISKRKNMCKNKCCRQTSVCHRPNNKYWIGNELHKRCTLKRDSNAYFLFLFLYLFPQFFFFFFFYFTVFVDGFKFELLQYGPAAQYPIRTTVLFVFVQFYFRLHSTFLISTNLPIEHYYELCTFRVY